MGEQNMQLSVNRVPPTLGQKNERAGSGLLVDSNLAVLSSPTQNRRGEELRFGRRASQNALIGKAVDTRELRPQTHTYTHEYVCVCVHA